MIAHRDSCGPGRDRTDGTRRVTAVESRADMLRPLATLMLGAAGALALAGCGGTTTVVPASAPTTAGTTAPAPPATDTRTAPPRTALPTPPTTDAQTTPATGEDGARIRRPAGFPNGGEAYLLARLDPAVAPYCTREPSASRAGGSVAGLYCATAGRFGVDAYYDLFPTRARLEASYGRYRRANDVPLDSGDCVPGPGVRASGIPSEGTWGYATNTARREGRVMCFRSDGRVWLVTSHNRIRTLSFFAADRRRQVNDFWYGAGFPSLTPR